MRHRTGMMRRPPGTGRRARKPAGRARAQARWPAAWFGRWPRRWSAIVRWFVIRPLRLLLAHGWLALLRRFWGGRPTREDPRARHWQPR